MNISPKPVIINTPQGVRIRMVWNPRFVRNLTEAFGSQQKLQEYVDGTIWESIKPYVPYATGSTQAVANAHTVIGEGKLTWVGPHVRYLYHGMLMVDPKYKIGAFHNPVTGQFWSRRGIKKIETDTPLKFKGGGKRGARWAERWMEDNLHQFQIDLQRKASEMLRQ